MQQTITHPNVMPVLHYEFQTNPAYYIMPLAETVLVEEGRFNAGNEDFIRLVFGQVLRGMQAAHSKGIVHRDIKPQNILKLSNDQWVVSDFGAGRELDRETTTITRSAEGIGTLDYMAPEQYSDPHETDRRADVFALGKLLMFMIAGEVRDPFRPARIPGHIYGVIVDRATQQEKEHRYQTIDEMIDAFERIGAATDWVSPTQTYQQLVEKIRSEKLSDETVDEMVTFLSTNDREEFYQALVPYISMPVLQSLQLRSDSSFREIIRRYDQHVSGGLEFTYCDVVADFYRQLTLSFPDDMEMFRMVIRRLFDLGENHNRFHVRDVILGLLAGSQGRDRVAIADSEIRANPSAAKWAFERDIPNDAAPDIVRAIEWARSYSASPRDWSSF